MVGKPHSGNVCHLLWMAVFGKQAQQSAPEAHQLAHGRGGRLSSQQHRRPCLQQGAARGALKRSGQQTQHALALLLCLVTASWHCRGIALLASFCLRRQHSVNSSVQCLRAAQVQAAQQAKVRFQLCLGGPPARRCLAQERLSQRPGGVAWGEEAWGVGE